MFTKIGRHPRRYRKSRNAFEERFRITSFARMLSNAIYAIKGIMKGFRVHRTHEEFYDFKSVAASTLRCMWHDPIHKVKHKGRRADALALRADEGRD